MDPERNSFLRACVEKRANINILNGMSNTQQKLLTILEDFLWSRKKSTEVLEETKSCQHQLNIEENMLVCEDFEKNAIEHFTSQNGDWDNSVTVDNVLKGCKHYLYVAQTLQTVVRELLNWSVSPRTFLREYTSEELNKVEILEQCQNALSIIERETALLESELSSLGNLRV